MAVAIDVPEYPQDIHSLPTGNEIEDKLWGHCHLLGGHFKLPEDARLQMYSYLLIPASLYFVVAAFLQRRRNKWKEHCDGRPGIPVPVNIIEQQSDRGIFIAAFVLIGMRIQELIFDGPAYAFAQNVHVFIRMPVVLVAGCLSALVFYPIVAALTTPHPLTYLFGTIYTWITLILIAFTHEFPCENPLDKTRVWVFHILSIVPLCIAYAYLCLKYPWKFIQSIRGRSRKYKSYYRKRHNYQFYHVKLLFAKGKPISETTKKVEGNIITRIKDYIWSEEPSFPYSLCFLAGIAFTLAFIWMQTLHWMQRLSWLVSNVGKVVNRIDGRVKALRQSGFGSERAGFASDLVSTLVNATIELQLVSETNREVFLNNFLSWLSGVTGYLYIYFTYLELSVYLMVALTFAATTNALLLSIQNYKRHLLHLFRGTKHKGIWRYSKNLPGPTVASSLKYMGYQFGFTLWAFAIVFVVCTFLALPLAMAMFLIINEGKYRLLIWPLNTLVIPFFWLVVTVWSQKWIARLFFLQKNLNGQYVLALDNRRAFFNLQYFMIFANAAVGLFACLKRLFYALLFGLWNLPRLDVSTLNRFWERWDNGHMAYVGLLNLQNSLTNPCMVVFAKILMQCKDDSGTDSGKIRARNRWFLAITLFNNPFLRVQRYEYLKLVKGRRILMSEMTNTFLRQAIMNSQLVALPGINMAPEQNFHRLESMHARFPSQKEKMTLAKTASFDDYSSEDEATIVPRKFSHILTK